MTTKSVTDLKLTEEFIEKISDSPEQAEAVKNVLGITKENERLIEAYTPERPTVHLAMDTYDRVEMAQRAVDRYTEWVESYPDEEPVPLAERQRVLLKAKKTLERAVKNNVGI